MRSIDLFHRLPYTLRCVAASLHGRRLEAWRYGAQTEGLVHAARERETWTDTDWRTWTAAALPSALRQAAESVPHYRRLWRDRRGDPSDLSAWPRLDKETLRSHGSALLADGTRPARLYAERTSGSTGTPVTLWHSRGTLHAWYALAEARIRNWNNVAHGDRWAILGGQLVTPPRAQKPPYWVWNQASRQLYLSLFHLRAETVEAYVEVMQRSRVRYLHGYPSAMATLAQLALDRGLTPPPLDAVLSNAEPLMARQRAIIEAFFAVPVRDTYGTAEFVVGASECAEGGLHLWPEVGHLEILDDDGQEQADAQPGRLVCTSLLSREMPLVRYEVGDRAARAGGTCGCGRRLPLLAGIEGRLDDEILTADGRRLGRLDHVFKADMPIREAQIIQRRLDLIEVRLVPGDGWGPAWETILDRRFRERLGTAPQIEMRLVERLPRTASGKLRAVVSELQGTDERESEAAVP